MSDGDRCDAQPTLQVANLDLHLLPEFAVKGGHRLVHQQERRAEHDGAGERHALLLTT